MDINNGGVYSWKSRLKRLGIIFSLFICKKRTAVYTTTALKVPNFFVIFLPTIIDTLINTPQGAFQQPLRR